ncbi:MAG: hypothetical protein SH819_11305 [Cytophagales bacterium]|nr:hypothetical protein [Cytophagales bacterium]
MKSSLKNLSLLAGGIRLPWILLLVLAACGPGTPQEAEEEDYSDSLAVTSLEEDLGSVEYITASGKKWVVTQSRAQVPGTVNVRVECRHFTEEDRVFDYAEVDPVSEVLKADLDGNGFEELYILAKGPKPESFITIYGLNSDKDLDVVEIYFEGATPYNSKPGEPFEGYRGWDTFLLEDGQLFDIFPVYLDGDAAENPSGGKRKVLYKLVKTESTWSLRPIRSEQVE